MAMNTRTHLALRLKKEWSYNSTPPLGLYGLLYSEFHFYFYGLRNWGHVVRFLAEIRNLSLLQIVQTSYGYNQSPI